MGGQCWKVMNMDPMYPWPGAGNSSCLFLCLIPGGTKSGMNFSRLVLYKIQQKYELLISHLLDRDLAVHIYTFEFVKVLKDWYGSMRGTEKSRKGQRITLSCILILHVYSYLEQALGLHSDRIDSRSLQDTIPNDPLIERETNGE